MLNYKINKRNCHDCGAMPGILHSEGCDVERCSVCGGQRIACNHNSLTRLPWKGWWPGVAECEEFGWYCKMVPGQGFVSCDKNDPESTEDLNRLYVEAKWSQELGRFIKKDTDGGIK